MHTADGEQRGGVFPRARADNWEDEEMRRSSMLRAGVVVAMAAVLAMACGSDNAVAPKYQPQVVNTPNVAFSFQATGLTNVDDVVSYNWSVSSGDIIIHPSTATSGGTITLRIKDGAGAVVYDGDVPASGDIDLPASAAGTWRVHVSLVNYSGTINFALQMQ
jgi:hypothetical protein